MRVQSLEWNAPEVKALAAAQDRGQHPLGYMNEKPNGLTGTAFWKNKNTGLDNIDLDDLEAHDEALKYAEDLDAWELQSVVGHKKNRFLSYPCSQYHSKYPNITEESRIVCVIFYKYERAETK